MIKGYFCANIYTPGQDNELLTRLQKAMKRGEISGLGSSPCSKDFNIYWFDLETVEVSESQALIRVLAEGYEYSFFFYIPEINTFAQISGKGIALEITWADIEVIAPV